MLNNEQEYKKPKLASDGKARSVEALGLGAGSSGNHVIFRDEFIEAAAESFFTSN